MYHKLFQNTFWLWYIAENLWKLSFSTVLDVHRIHCIFFFASFILCLFCFGEPALYLNECKAKLILCSSNVSHQPAQD